MVAKQGIIADRCGRWGLASRRGQVRLYLVSALMVLIVVFGACPFKVGIVVGDSMTPSLKPNQPFIIDRSYPGKHHLAKGDVIVFQQGDDVLIKRIAVGPGGSLWLYEYPEDWADSIVIGPEELSQYAKLARRYPGKGRIRHVVLQSDQVFVVGDRVHGSLDSRHFGPISVSQVIGKVLVPQAKIRTAGVRPGDRHAYSAKS